jgi:hypothetical protein
MSNDESKTKEAFAGVYDQLIKSGLVDAARERLDPEAFTVFEERFMNMAGVYDEVIHTINNMEPSEKETLLKEAFQKHGMKMPRQES